MEEDGDRLARGVTSEDIVDGFTPEGHAHASDGGVGYGLGEASEFEVQGTKGTVCVLGGGRDESAEEEGFVVAMFELVLTVLAGLLNVDLCNGRDTSYKEGRLSRGRLRLGTKTGWP